MRVIVTTSLEFDSMEEYLAHARDSLPLAEAALDMEPGKIIRATGHVEEAVKADPAPKKRVVKKAAAAEEKPEPAPAPQPEATQEDAQKAVERLVEAKGVPTGLAVLGRYGVKRIRDMKPEHYAKFIKHADEVIAGGEV